MKKIFIGHGRSELWKDLRDFIRDRLGLDWDEFNRIPTAGTTNISRLSEMLADADFALLILTAEDEQSDGKKIARLNVIHELGLFQGKLGFQRAIVLLEDGCEEFSNIHGLVQIRFPPKNLEARFEEIRRVLERERLVGVSASGVHTNGQTIDRQAQGAAWIMGACFAEFQFQSLVFEAAKREGRTNSEKTLKGILNSLANTISSLAPVAKVSVSRNINDVSDSYFAADRVWPVSVRRASEIAYRLMLISFRVREAIISNDIKLLNIAEDTEKIRLWSKDAHLPDSIAAAFLECFESVQTETNKQEINESLATSIAMRVSELLRAKRDEIELLSAKSMSAFGN